MGHERDPQLLGRSRHGTSRARVARDLDPEQRALLDRYVSAFWDKDVDALVQLFTDKAVWEMPPYPEWFTGAEAIARLVANKCPAGVHDMVMLPTRANGQPAFGLYMRADDGRMRAFHLQQLTVGPQGVERVTAYFDLHLFERFGLPLELSA